MSELNDHDKAVLNSIFNPTLPIGEAVYDENLPDSLQDDDNDNSEKYSQAKSLENEAVKAAEKGDLDKSLEILNLAIQLTPNRPSGYNNRAQVYRLKGNDKAAFDDLTTAINLSGGKGRSCCQALCQRGLLYRKDKNEDKAKDDFTSAAQLGSQFAKMQLVEMNPYAAMCNAMLKKVMSELK